MTSDDVPWQGWYRVLGHRWRWECAASSEEECRALLLESAAAQMAAEGRPCISLVVLPGFHAPAHGPARKGRAP